MSNPIRPSTLTLPRGEAALAGINTPLGGFYVQGAETAAITVIITAGAGVLYAGTAAGATVSGGGTSTLQISGAPAQVNAKLASLVYLGRTVGMDTLTLRLIDTSGQASGPLALPIEIMPLVAPPGMTLPEVLISGGTLTLDARTIDGVALALHDAQTSAGAATLVLIGSSLGPNTTVDVTSSGASSPAPRIATAGRVLLQGATTLNAGPALLTIANHALLDNQGRITFNDSTAHMTGAGVLQNDGTIAVAATAPGAGPAIDVAITGSGVISIGAGAHLELGGSLADTATIRFEADTGTLQLGAPNTMQATISDFRPGDRIELGRTHIDAADYTPSGAGGTLTLFDGARVAASLNFAGVHQLGDFIFSVATDVGPEAASITTLSVLAPTHAAAAAADPQIYRFFDRAHGTQLLTNDPAERDAIIASRSDLAFEGTAMRALTDPTADPAAVAVYRFFDSVHGTHFFTADLAEKSTLLVTRPDLILEPNSTIWQHATQQAGDVPVFRFFDTSNGTHFYTASASERASILTARPDLASEGVAFYAPGQ